MDYQILDWESYPRRDHFSYFCSMANPYVGVTMDVEITGFPEACKDRGIPFFLSFLHCIGRAANAVPQLRQRILEDRPVEFPHCDTSHTVMRPDGTYSYCRLDPMEDLDAFLEKAIPLPGGQQPPDHLG